jgi:hypothetical protein
MICTERTDSPDADLAAKSFRTCAGVSALSGQRPRVGQMWSLIVSR